MFNDCFPIILEVDTEKRQTKRWIKFRKNNPRTYQFQKHRRTF